jgi:hypothetical protein
MSVPGGQLVRLQVDGIELDPMGDFTLRESGIKRELLETTRKGTKFAENAIAGLISGAVENDPDIDFESIKNAKDAPVLAEEANGQAWAGTMTYSADGDIATNAGTFQLELMGDFKKT